MRTLKAALKFIDHKCFIMHAALFEDSDRWTTVNLRQVFEFIRASIMLWQSMGG